MGADYDRWVHDPIVQKEPPRFFESDIAEVINSCPCIKPLTCLYSKWKNLTHRIDKLEITVSYWFPIRSKSNYTTG